MSRIASRPAPAWASAAHAPARVRAFLDVLDEQDRLTGTGATDAARARETTRAALAELVAHDDWLPAAYAAPDPAHYQQYLLYRDPAARYSIVSFVWGPGQATPVHDHTVWGLIGVLRGAEYSQPYAVIDETRDNAPGAAGRVVPAGPPVRLAPGEVEAVGPDIGDIHRVSNVYDDRVSISIHVYGADIGAVERWVYHEDGARKRFVSGYSTPKGVAAATPAVATSTATLPAATATAAQAITATAATAVAATTGTRPAGTTSAAAAPTVATTAASTETTASTETASTAHPPLSATIPSPPKVPAPADSAWVVPSFAGAPNANARALFRLDAAQVRAALRARAEIALVDLREEDAFARAHPLWAANFPLSRLELDAWTRIPRRDTTIVLYGDDDNDDDDDAHAHAENAHGAHTHDAAAHDANPHDANPHDANPHDADARDASLVARGAAVLAALGYTNVHALDGGLDGWRAAGGEIFIDVNVPSKAFGELVESVRHTPSLSAQEVQRLIDARENAVIVDARRFDEYQTMSIPGAVSVPGAELVLRVRALAPDPATRVIVNCAGRTRSIIGAQSLINAQLPNPVAALRNGTIGWTLAGQQLAHGATRRFPETIDDAHRQAARANAQRVAARAGVARIAWSALASLDEPGRTVYRFDVRTPGEYAAGHLPGFLSAPGGQLVQETDHHAPVRGARLVLADDDGVRASMSASWLAQMGWETYVVELAGDVGAPDGVGTLEASDTSDGLGAAGVPGMASASDTPDAPGAAGTSSVSDITGALDATGASGARDASRTSNAIDASGTQNVSVASASSTPDTLDAPGTPPTPNAPHTAPKTSLPRTQTGQNAPPAPQASPVPTITASMLAAWLHDQASAFGASSALAIIDVTRSANYVQRHIPGAWFAIRAQLRAALAHIPAAQRYVVTCDSGRLAAFAAADLRALLPASTGVWLLAGGTLAWIAAGLPLEHGETRLASPRIDRYRRPYEGTDNATQAMQAYLDWEFGLVEQLGRDGTHGFRVI